MTPTFDTDTPAGEKPVGGPMSAQNANQVGAAFSAFPRWCCWVWSTWCR